VQVMDGMVRLAEKFIQLHQAGCVLFLDWVMSFYFSEASRVACTIGFYKSKKTLKGKKTEPNQIASYIATVSLLIVLYFQGKNR
jgi:hypothetical protein